jgi:cell division protease FtsH
LEEVVEFLRDPKKFARLGGRVPKGVLLVGPPGTGKTLLARAVAGEAGVPFYFTSGSDFVEMYVGVGASRVRDLFAQAKNSAPCIVFIDEIDAVGRHRGSGMGSGNEEREQTLNQLLVEMDGFQPNSGIIVIAATNRSDILDKALTRPGRFDREVVVSNPDLLGRQKILQTHAKKIPLDPEVDVRVIARGTPGFSGAELANLVNEAALLAARGNSQQVSMHHFEAAKDKVLMGAERRSLAMSESERQLTAYHEAGHALVSLALPASDPIHKATIVPRGGALGMVMRLPEGDRVSMTREKLEADLAVAMGGRCAEALIFGRQKVTTGAQGDIAQATRLARRMVTEWGMSDSLGLMAYVPEDGANPGGASGSGLSEEVARRVDAEVRRLLDEAYTRTNAILTARQADLRRLAQALLDYETLTGQELKRVASGLPLERADDLPPSDSEPSLPESAPLGMPVPANQPTIDVAAERPKIRVAGAVTIGRFEPAAIATGTEHPSS